VRPSAATPPAPVPTPAPAPALVGKVLTINRENNFIVIDLGSDNGVKVGNIFSIYRDIGGKSIADVEIIQLRKNISACDIKKESVSIHVGDVVK
jgi:hypothetical protein